MVLHQAPPLKKDLSLDLALGVTLFEDIVVNIHQVHGFI